MRSETDYEMKIKELERDIAKLKAHLRYIYGYVKPGEYAVDCGRRVDVPLILRPSEGYLKELMDSNEPLEKKW
jgi:hypothetical protein